VSHFARLPEQLQTAVEHVVSFPIAVPLGLQVALQKKKKEKKIERGDWEVRRVDVHLMCYWQVVPLAAWTRCQKYLACILSRTLPTVCRVVQITRR
jgi:hypothetical protein